ncbi:uncharacterized protein LOC122662019 isoform X2 [Telopea speciosissima]|uniref:uncharacterized protein LOC122662019 isoform X2 n=1 Tax=Telopea speciosissima TaxID=54955 RepID=UPI001CC7658D|nr:uncharacterized protein LOC122662019 isoform X2 [Telopea speciosissima]
MDAVKFSLPAVVAVSKLLNAESFSRGGVTTVEEAEVRKAEVGSILGTPPPINGWISSCSSKDVMRVVTTSEQDSASRHRKAEVGSCSDEKKHSNFQSENITEHGGNVNSSLFMLPKSAGKHCNRKAGKSESTSPCSKRQRTDQLEDAVNHDGTDDSNLISEKPGSSQAKCTFAEKSGAVKQKHGRDGKRVKAKNKLDPFFPKGGLLSSNSAVGGNNILGIYGLKSDIHHVTKHVDELPLNELLDGSYECYNLCQDIGKKVGNTNEDILHSVRKACSILQFKRPVQSQNSFELDGSSNRKAPSWLVISGSCGTSSMDCDKLDNNRADLTSYSEIHDSSSKPGPSVNFNNSSLLQPKDILERLALPPAKDLDSLLLDVAKPTVSSRSSTDLRPSKLTSKRVGLPPFSWSHSMPCKMNADVGKLCTTRSTSQGRWVRIGSAASSHGDARGRFSDLDSLSYDLSLVPSRGLKLGLSEEEKVPPVLVKPPWYEPSSSIHPASQIPEADQDMKYQGNSDISKGLSANNFLFQEQKDNLVEKEQSKIKSDGGSANSYCSPSKSAAGGCNGLLSNSLIPENSKEVVHSPRVLAAAHILCEMASDFRKPIQNNEKIRWPKKPSQKAMKACKSKCSTGKAVLSVAAKSVKGSGDLVKFANQMTLSKPPKFSTTDKNKDLDYTNNLGRGLIKWPTGPTPTSSTSSPSKLEKVPVADSKLLNTNMVNLLGMKPFSSRVPEKACNSHQKPRKPLTVDWVRGRCKKE